MKLIDMDTVFRFDMLLPIGLIVLQELLLLFAGISILKKMKFLVTPIACMDYSQVIVVGCFLFGITLIGTGDIEGLFQSYKTFQNAGRQVYSNTFSKFSEYFLTVLIFEILFA